MLGVVFQKLNSIWKLQIHKMIWRKRNSHNNTFAKNKFPIGKVSVGRCTYGQLNVSFFGNSSEKLIIGNYCCISSDVKFVLGGEHHPEYLMNFPFKIYLEPDNDIDDRRTKGPIVIGDDVWIGKDAIILSGVSIGQGAIIAAGTIVSKDVPPYAVYSTNRIIKYRFSDDIIDKLLNIDFSKLDLQFVKENMNLFYDNDVNHVLEDSKIIRFTKGYKGDQN